MNKTRRKEIQKSIGDIRDVLQGILEDERESYDNMPEGLQSSENGIASEDAQENLEAAIDALEEAIFCLEDVV